MKQRPIEFDSRITCMGFKCLSADCYFHYNKMPRALCTLTGMFHQVAWTFYASLSWN